MCKMRAIMTWGLIIAVIWATGNALDHLAVLNNNRRLKQALTSLDVQTVTLNDVVPFKWDMVYTFDSYVSKEEMANVIGFKSGALRETASEGMIQLVFVRGRKVVCGVCGYSDALGYSICFSTDAGKSDSRLAFNDNEVFSVEKSEGIVYLSHMAGDTLLAVD